MWTNICPLSILTAVFPCGPGLAGARLSPFWILLELRMMDVVVTTGAITHAKLQSNRHHQVHQTNTQSFLQAGCPSCRPTYSGTIKGKSITLHGLAHPKLTWGLLSLSLTTKGSWLPCGRLSSLSSAVWLQYPAMTMMVGSLVWWFYLVMFGHKSKSLDTCINFIVYTWTNICSVIHIEYCFVNKKKTFKIYFLQAQLSFISDKSIIF